MCWVHGAGGEELMNSIMGIGGRVTKEVRFELDVERWGETF